MRMATAIRGALMTAGITGVLACVLTSAAGAYPLRNPQVPLQTGWDNISLQSALNSLGETLNTLTDQLDLQAWNVPSGSASLSLRMEIAGNASSNNIGVYSTSDATPALCLVFPGAAAAGWYATCVFSSGNHLVVSLYDNNNVFQGSTNYSNISSTSFGFYLQGPAGTFYSQDYRNAGGHPQILTYAGTGTNAGKWWECFEDLPYESSDVDFQDAIMLLDSSFLPTPTRNGTWGALKALYR